MLKDWAHIPALSNAVAPRRVWPLSEAGQPEKAHGEYVRMSVVLQCNGACTTQEKSAFACSRSGLVVGCQIDRRLSCCMHGQCIGVI